MENNKYIKLPYFGIPKLLPFLKNYRKEITRMVMSGILVSLIDATYPLFNRYAIDHFIALNTLDTLPYFIAIFLFTLVVQVVTNYITVSLCGVVELRMNQILRNASFNHLQTLSFSYFNQNNVGYIHARVMSDSGKIGELCSWKFMEIIWNGAYILAITIIMLNIDFRLTLYVLALVPMALFVISYFQKKLIVLNRKIREINSQISADFNEGITGAKSIKTLVIEDKIQQGFEKTTSSMLRTSVRTTRHSALFSASITMISSLAVAIILWRGGLVTIQGIMKIGTLSVFISYAISLLEPIQNMISAITNLISIQVNIERFTTLIETTSDVSDSPEIIKKYGDVFHPKKENWEPLHGDIAFEDVSFRYPDGDEMILEHFNLTIPQGTNVAIVGETGAGKSTLVNLVCRFFEPTSGKVLIDGVDAKKRSQSWLHSHIGYVLQTPHLFSGTVRENLRYGKPDATDEEIIEALKLVSAQYLLQKLDHGLDSQVGEGGDLLSTGEKQLLSFARALLANPRILILDEATSSIDTITEKAIQDAISVVIKGRTSFVIAHRLSTIVNADIILVVKEGKILERGTHKELLKEKGYYYDLYRKQFSEIFNSI